MCQQLVVILFMIKLCFSSVVETSCILLITMNENMTHMGSKGNLIPREFEKFFMNFDASLFLHFYFVYTQSLYQRAWIPSKALWKAPLMNTSAQAKHVSIPRNNDGSGRPKLAGLWWHGTCLTTNSQIERGSFACFGHVHVEAWLPLFLRLCSEHGTKI